MELGFLAVLALVAWYLWSQHVRQARAREDASRRAAEERTTSEKRTKKEALATREIEKGQGIFREWWRFCFPAMQLEHTTSGTTTALTRTLYNLRRNSEGQWQVRLDETELAAAIHFRRIDYLGDPKDPQYVAPSDEDEQAWSAEEKRIKSRQWEPLPDDFAPRVETHYQRFVTHYDP